MKGILFAGDSYTWGEALHFYSDLPDIQFIEQGFDGRAYTPAHIRYIEANRFARLVANHFNTFELCRYSNGGNNDDIFSFIDNLPTELKTYYVPAMHNEPLSRAHQYELKDFDYIVIQLTDMFRNDVTFTYKGTIRSCNIKSEQSIITSEFDAHIKDEFNNDLNKFIDYYLNKVKNNIIEKIKSYESNGIKRCFIHTWQTEIVPYLLNDTYLNERWIRYEVDGEIYNTIWDLQRNDKLKGMSLNDDPYFLEKGINVYNGHTSKKAHKIQAESIIKKIEEYEQSAIYSVQRPII